MTPLAYAGVALPPLRVNLQGEPSAARNGFPA
jgi:hypothetical protein